MKPHCYFTLKKYAHAHKNQQTKPKLKTKTQKKIESCHSDM